MQRDERLNNFLRHSEEISKDCRIAGGEIYLTNKRIISNKVSLLKKISLSSQTSFFSIPLADIVSCRIARGIPFFSLPRLIVEYRKGKKSREIFFEFANKEELKGFYEALCDASALSLRATEGGATILNDCSLLCSSHRHIT